MKERLDGDIAARFEHVLADLATRRTETNQARLNRHLVSFENRFTKSQPHVHNDERELSLSKKLEQTYFFCELPTAFLQQLQVPRVIYVAERIAMKSTDLKLGFVNHLPIFSNFSLPGDDSTVL